MPNGNTIRTYVWRTVDLGAHPLGYRYPDWRVYYRYTGSDDGYCGGSAAARSGVLYPKAGTSGASTRRASALELSEGLPLVFSGVLLLTPGSDGIFFPGPTAASGDRSLVAAAFPNLERDWP